MMISAGRTNCGGATSRTLRCTLIQNARAKCRADSQGLLHSRKTQVFLGQRLHPSRVPIHRVCARRRGGDDIRDQDEEDGEAQDINAEDDDITDDTEDAVGEGEGELDDFNLDELISSRQTDDLNLEAVFEKMGLVDRVQPRAGTAPSEEEPRVEYPEMPELRCTFGELLARCGYDDEVLAQYDGCLEVEITGIQHDSRAVKPGELFVCHVGANFDGHLFIGEAIQNGASMILARLDVPGADVALNYDFDFEIEDSPIAESDVFACAARDDAVMQAAEAELQAMFEKVDAFAEANGLSEEERQVVEAAQGFRILESAAGYSIGQLTHEDTNFTAHPWNARVPLECPIPVAFAIHPLEFAGVLANTFYGLPSCGMTVVGVTGTNGKTTTAWLMRSVFEQMGLLTGLVGTVEYALGTDRLDVNGDLWKPPEDEEEDTTLERESSTPFWAAPYQGKYSVPCTTPDAIQIQRIMHGMFARGAQACVMEASSIGLEQGRLAEVDFDVAIFTNLTHDHLDYHETMEFYAGAKAKLFQNLGDPQRQRAVLNKDDPFFDFFVDNVSAETKPDDEPVDVVPIMTYSMDPTSDADVYVASVRYSIWETDMIIATPLGRLQIITPLIGKANVYNILGVVAACVAMDVPLETIVAAVENCEVVPGRFELIDEGQDFSVIVDYAHTPDALSELLDTCRMCGAKRIILVFGCGGDRDKAKRSAMGDIAHFKADIVILTNDNPRREAPEDIIQDIVSGFPESVRNSEGTIYENTTVYNYLQDVGRIDPIFESEVLERQGQVKRYIMEDRYLAIRAAIGTATKGDMVVIAGKGHEDYIEYANVDGEVFKAWFDDRVEARNALSKLQYLEQIPYLMRTNLPWIRKEATKSSTKKAQEQEQVVE